MSQSSPLVFSNITPAQYSLLIAKAQSSGIHITGNSGTTSKYGVEVAWSYSPDARRLTLQCLKTPFFMSTSDVHTKLQSLVEQSITAA
jgi:hypothetical protein